MKSQLRRYTRLGAAIPVENAHIYETGGLSINDDLKEVRVDGDVVKLTPIEYNILLLLMKNQGRVFSINQIYENIWNEEAVAADNTVAVHIRHIREKIEINPRILSASSDFAERIMIGRGFSSLIFKVARMPSSFGIIISMISRSTG